MMNSTMRYILQLIIFSIVVFGVHYASLYVFETVDQWKGAPISLIQIYFVQILLSALTCIAVVAIKNVMPNNLGFVFLGLITLRLIVSYIFIKPVLGIGDQIQFVKYHFLIVFVLFMAYDVYVTSKLLKQIDAK